MPVTALPPIEIRSARWLIAAWIPLPLIAPAAILLIAILNGDGPDGGEIAGQLAFVGLMVVVAVAVIVLVGRSQRRMRERRRAEAPPGTVLAADAAALEVQSLDHPSRLRRMASWSAGVLEIGADGVRFRHSKPGQTFPEVTFAWSEVESVMCERENPFRVYLHVRTTTRQDHAWRVGGAPAVEAALRRLRDGA